MKLCKIIIVKKKKTKKWDVAMVVHAVTDVLDLDLVVLDVVDLDLVVLDVVDQDMVLMDLLMDL
jgi:hypothetical protein